MTGAYVRIERNGKWQSIEMECLTTEERKKFFSGKKKSEILRWLDLMCVWIAKIEPLYREEE